MAGDRVRTELLGDLDGPVAVAGGTDHPEPMAGDRVRTELLGDLDGPVASVGGADHPETMAGDWVRRELLGDLDGPVASVDRAGTIALLDAGWRVGWGVGAGDRWHIAAEETAVRTRLVDGMPVVATSMRVPGGDVVQRAAAVRDASGRGVVLEFVNESAGPVSVALAVSGSTSTVRVRGSRLLADGRVAVELDRTPGGAAAVSDGEVWRAVRAGPPAGDCEARSRSGLAAAAVLVPLAVGVPLRLTLPVAGGPVEARPPERVAAGWLSLVSRAASAALPDETAERAWLRGIAACILAAGGAGAARASRAAVVLDRVGLPDEADRGREVILRASAGSGGRQQRRLVQSAAGREVILRASAGSGPAAGDAVAGLRALASRRLRSGRVSGLAEWAGPLVDAAGDHLDALTLEQVASALEPEAPAAARDARRLLTETPARAPVTRSAASDGRVEAATRDSIAFGGDGLAGIEAVLDCLVAEAADHVVMAPALPAAWRGASADALSIVTRHGTLSFSVRWHGSRPALLWDLQQPRSAEGSAVGLRCGLDPSWSAPGSAGEALLNPA